MASCVARTFLSNAAIERPASVMINMAVKIQSFFTTKNYILRSTGKNTCFAHHVGQKFQQTNKKIFTFVP